MRKQKLTPIGAAFAALVLLVVLFLARGALQRPARVVLPQETDVSGESGGRDDDADAVGRVDVRPETVQSAIATLERPVRYTRQITIERYFSGGSGVDSSTVSVDGSWMRVDTEHSGGDVTHTVTSGERVWIWYGNGKQYFESAASFSADEEQGIATYEDILALEVSRIAEADYRLLNGVDCIYVETTADESGYIERYWVSVSDGLLCAAEKLHGEEVVYRMAGMSVELGGITAEVFTLPDGTILHAGAEETAR